jgi:N-methylhydantoinase A
MTAASSACGAVRAGIDVGGTFTDAALVDAQGRLHVAKTRTTPGDLGDGFEVALAEVASSAGIPLSGLDYLVHGTTVATNSIVQGRLARTALITNEGFRDILEIGTQQRRRVYDLWSPQPAPLVPRERCHAVRGRIGADGSEVEPLSEEDVAAVAARLLEQQVQAVAVVGLFAFVNPAHEQRIEALLDELLPGVPVACSSRVAPEFREYLRASTTVLNAALLPVAGAYVERLSGRLGGHGVAAPLHLMQSNGGVATAQRAARLPVSLAASGPAAGVIGAARLGLAAGHSQLLTFDMGGTTADIALVVDGLPQLRFQGDQHGHPVNLPQVDVLSVGAGGGSLASVDRFGSLTVGPDSAGAAPGPACYGAGGTRPTVTDAHVVLGSLDARRALGGGVRLDRAAACAAVEAHVSDPLGIGVEAGAEAILRIANANMAGALRVVSVARGHDPRDFALVALGGAGPMHACALADDLGVARILVPRHPGVTAALGLLLADVRHDLRLTWLRRTADVDAAELDAALGVLADEGRALLAGAGDAAPSAIEFELDMRYRGQAYNLTVPLAAEPLGPGALAAAEDAFHAAHRQAYDYTPAVTETEIVTLRARAVATTAGDGPAARSAPLAPAAARERVLHSSHGPQAYAVVDRSDLRAGQRVAPRTIVEQEDATIVVADGWSGAAGNGGILVLTRDAA